jgi:hypothetical protein
MDELHYLGEARRDRGEYDEAERLLEEAVAVAHSVGSESQLSNSIHPETALARYIEGMEFDLRTKDRRGQIYYLAGIASALAQSGDAMGAARVWGSAEAQERELGFRMLLNERRRYERWMSAAQEHLGETFETAREAGARLTLDEAVSEVLREVPAIPTGSPKSAP